MSVKTILISQFPLPYHKIGSWTTMYNYYLFTDNHSIDCIVCQEPESPLKSVDYLYTDTTNIEKLERKITKNKYTSLFKRLSSLFNKTDKYLIQIIDNHGLVLPLNYFLQEKGIRNNCYLQFFYHGFSTFYDSFNGGFFFEALDEHVMLTQKSYDYYKNYYATTPCIFSVLHNGIDSKKFYISSKQKEETKNQLIFTWCSQDRPKKGLDFILRVWKLLIKKYDNIELQIIGVNKEINIPQTNVIGKVPNNELPKYLQKSDFYLFPTLCHEGFGLSLVEALKCGCYCIASNYGGVSEVLANGKYGKLIDNPNFIEEWLKTIESSLEEYINNNYVSPYIKNYPEKLYDLEDWCSNMNKLINRAKKLIA